MSDSYKGYKDWEKLVNRYYNLDFSDEKIRRRFREDFEEISRLMWAHWISHMDVEDLAAELSEAWFNLENIKYKSVVEAYDEALSYCWYASDRMNINRWLRIRTLLNYDVE